VVSNSYKVASNNRKFVFTYRVLRYHEGTRSPLRNEERGIDGVRCQHMGRRDNKNWVKGLVGNKAVSQPITVFVSL